MGKAFEQLQPYLDKDMALTTALTLLEWDNETLAPADSITNTSKAIGILSQEQFEAIINNDVKNILKELESEEEYDKLSQKEKAIIKQLKRTIRQLEDIPSREYKEYSELSAVAPAIWAKAREHNSYEEFAPTLGKLIEYKKRFAGYRQKKGEELYNILLDDYEEGINMDFLDNFFERVKEEVLPLLREVSKHNDTISKAYNTLSYPVEGQREFCRWISTYIGFDFNRGVLAESAHPFTTNLHNKDVRITTNYHEHNLESSIFSVIHESGHAIYEMGISDKLTQTIAGTGVSMGVHESQSRFFENVVGRSYEFWKPVYSRLVSTFPEQLNSVPLEDFIRGINKAEPGAIRIEADELTYTLHIMIRYEIEKMIFKDEVSLEDLPKVWDDKYEEYLGVRPASAAQGILQDVHWSCGNFGYFPSYAIGNAIAAQLYYHMKSIMPFDKYLLEGDIKPIVEYLKENIHRYGTIKNMKELLTDIMNEELNVDYYIRYLKEKYTKIYHLGMK